MFLISTRKRNPDKTFGHQRMLKGDYAVYEISKASEGKDAQQKTLEDIPTNKDLLLLIHGFNNDFDEVTAAYLGFDRRVRAVGFNGNVIGFTWPSYGEWFQYFGDIEQVEYASFGFLNFLLAFRPLLGEREVGRHPSLTSGERPVEHAFRGEARDEDVVVALRVVRRPGDHDLAAYSRINAIANLCPGVLL